MILVQAAEGCYTSFVVLSKKKMTQQLYQQKKRIELRIMFDDKKSTQARAQLVCGTAVPIYSLVISDFTALTHMFAPFM